MSMPWRCLSRLLMLTLLLNGCATLIPPRVPEARQFDAWATEHEYGKALAAIDALPAATRARPDLRARRTELERAAKEYERTVLTAARREQRRDNLAGAIHELDTALHNYPGSTVLRVERAGMRVQRQARQRALRDRLLAARVEWLLEQQPLQDQYARLDPDDLGARASADGIRAELDDAVADLLACGTHALAADRLDDAEQCLKLAQRVHDTGIVKQALEQLQARRKAQLQAARKKARAAHAPARADDPEELLGRARDALALSNLLEARQLLDEAQRIAADDPQVSALRQTLDQAVAAKVGMYLRKGNELYRDGEIDQARESWRAGLELAPEDEQLQANVERADRVLQKLQELQQNNTSEPAPAQ